MTGSPTDPRPGPPRPSAAPAPLARRRLLLAGLALAAAAHGAPGTAAEPAGLGPGDREAIREVIGRQLDAFRAGDGERAFGYAAPGIRAAFGTVDRFMAMVRESYRPVLAPREVEFRDLVELDGRPAQRVLLVGPDREAVVAHYVMERQPDGSWLIAGCVLVPSDETAL